MQALYRALAAGREDLPRALQRAQRTVRSEGRGNERPYAHPYYWAGFVLSAGLP
jgi:CHAT domain-containing protein